MADDNKISLDFEINEASVKDAYGKIEDQASKSAKSSAAVFGEHYQNSFNVLNDALERIVGTSRKSAKESADAFSQAFSRIDAEAKKRQDILQASQTQNIQNAISKITNVDRPIKSARDSAEAFGDAFKAQGPKIGGIIDKLGKFYLAAQGLEMVLRKAQEAMVFFINTALAGDKIDKIEKQFGMLATQAGLAGDALRNNLVGAAGGLVDDTDILQAANTAMLNLGENAKVLPDLLKISRQAASVTGQDVVKVFDDITTAVSTLNTRSLRQYGIVVNQDQIYKEWAGTLGVTADRLSETGKRNAILNNVLEQASEKFKNVKTEGDTATVAITRLKVVITNAYEEMQKSFAKGAGGGFIKETADYLRVTVFTDLPTRVKEAREKSAEELLILQKDLNDKINNLKVTPLGEKVITGIFGVSDDKRQEAIASYDRALTDINKLIAEKSGATFRSMQDTIKPIAPVVQPNPETDLTDKIQLTNEQILAQKLSLDQAIINAEIQKNQALEGIRTTDTQNRVNSVSMAEIAAAEKRSRDFEIEKQFEADKLALKSQYADLDLANKAKYAELEKLLVDKKNADLEKSQNEFLQSSQKGWLNLKKMFQDTLITGMAGAMSAYASALRKGEDANEAFSKAIIAALGGLAMQIGSMLVAVGLGFQAAGMILPAWATAGAGTVAAGLALMAIGADLQAQGGGGGGGATTAGGGTTAEADNEIDIPDEQDLEPRGPKVQVNLNVMGNILDRRETGLELAEILRSTIDDQGVSIGV